MSQSIGGKGDTARRREGLLQSIKADLKRGALKFERPELTGKFETELQKLVD